MIKETVEIMRELEKEMSLELIASEVERSFGTVWQWARGKRTPSKGDFELLKSLLTRIKTYDPDNPDHERDQEGL